MDLAVISRAVIDGLVLSSGYMLMGVGLTLVFGVLGIYNFAHGEFVMVGAYVAYVFFGLLHFPFPVVVLIAAVAVGGLGVVVERGLFRPVRSQPFLGFLLSIGLVYVLQVVAEAIFNPIQKSVPPVSFEMVKIGSLSFTVERLVLIPSVLLVMLIVWLFLEKTKYGRAVRATSQDPRSAALMGMSAEKMAVMVMFMAGVLAGLAGVVTSQFSPVNPLFGTNVIMKAFVVVIIGGSSSIGGAIVASLIFGLLTSFVSTFYSPGAAVLADALVMGLILVIRPQGLFGHE
ncbi:branched-chain amino acid ABC transporter permease [Chloroflexota bacterium]